MTWKKEDTDFLKENYNIKSIEEICLILNKSKKSVETKLGFLKKYDFQNINYVVKQNSANTSQWTNEEIKFIINNHSNLTCKEISTIINKSPNNIRLKILSLGLEIKREISKKQKSNWTDEEILFLKNNYSTMTRKQLVEKLNKTDNIIRIKISELGLKKYKSKKECPPFTIEEDLIITNICKDSNINKNNKIDQINLLLPNRNRDSIYRRIGKLNLRKYISKCETLPEKIIREILENENIKFKTQVRENKYLIDFVISNYAIEIQGDYWHCNPKKYPNGPKNDIQKRKINDDIKKKKILEEKGYIVIYFWEDDIYHNIENIKKQLNEIINKANGES